MKDFYKVTFTLKKELDKSYLVHKKTKNIDKEFFIPKSISEEITRYEKIVGNNHVMWGPFTMIVIKLPEWYCKKVLGFYR